VVEANDVPDSRPRQAGAAHVLPHLLAAQEGDLMGADSKIEWTHHTFNAWLGCSKVHAGCTNCYAEKHQAVNMRKGGAIPWGEVWQGGGRVVVSDSTWAHPLKWARAAAKTGERHRVFCSSLSDVLEVPDMPPFSHLTTALRDRVNEVRKALDDARARLWPIIEDTAWMCGGCGRPCAHSSDTPHRTARLLDLSSVGAACEGISGRCLNTPMGGLDFLLLTKRPENAHAVPPWARPLVWLGTSISDQQTADEWVPRLLAAEGFRYRFLSVEPLLGPVRLDSLIWQPCRACHGSMTTAVPGGGKPCVSCLEHQGLESAIDWVIVGGESGSKARPCNVEWIRGIVRQCREAGVPCHVKQLGAKPMVPREPGDAWGDRIIELADPKGGDWSEWPEDLRVRQFPETP
jgi:protein gp37